MTYDAAAGAASGPGGDTPSGPSASGAASRSGARADPVVLPPHLADAARTLFGEHLPLAATYAELLGTDGVVRGLIGPREAPRIWERHLLNCAAVAELIPPGSSVIDVGSGAGLPGLVLAVARPDLSVALIEPLARRTAFLTEVVTTLGLGRSVTVVRARAEEYARTPQAALPPGDIVTARAVAPLDRLAGWCLPLTTLGGRILALKGASAADEVADHRDAVGRLGGGTPVVRRCGVGLIDPPATVVEIVRERAVRGREAHRSRQRGARAADDVGRAASGEAAKGRSRRG
jgi:16S rRNA (guanine527-N7)-methyltransferase